MSAAALMQSWGTDLTPDDYAGLEERWVPRELADESGIRRVDSFTGREMFGRKGGNMAGLIIPNVAPWDASHVREYRLRLDSPAVEYCADGSTKEINKYVQPAQRPNLVYFPPGLKVGALEDTSLTAIITEGEFKGLALWRLANYAAESLRFLPFGLAGVWNFRGTIGKTTGPKGDRRDVRGIISDVDRISWKGRRVIIAFDADAEKNPKVRAARWRLTAALLDRGATVGCLEWPIEEGKGIDDRLATVGPDRVLADIAAVQFGGWRTGLLRSDTGKLIACYENVALFLENSPEWSGVLGYNQFNGGHFVLKPPPPPITATVDSEIEDNFDIETLRWLERRGVMVKPDVVRRVVDGVARRNSYHPVQEYLESLPPWDGTPRIGTWLIDYCHVESSDENPNNYAMAVGEKTLISAVARVMEPGCKADHVLVLEGEQGLGKSTAVSILAGAQWFTDQVADFGSKDASMQLRGMWIIELSELGSLLLSDRERVKAFISQQRERFRLPYGHRLVNHPRQCIFVGTTNSDMWLKDETGGRRFWPVTCRSGIDLAGLTRDRDQIWAEALVRYRKGIHWWLEDPELVKDAIEEQSGRYVADVWQDKVIAAAEEEAAMQESPSGGKKDSKGHGSVAIPEILHRLGIETPKQGQSAANRVARCLKKAHWERFKQGPRGEREWRYHKAVSQ